MVKVYGVRTTLSSILVTRRHRRHIDSFPFTILGSHQRRCRLEIMETEDDRRAMYAYIGILLAFKIFTLIVILWLTSSWEAVVFVVASHVLWLTVGAILIAGPATFWARLVRVRARRRQLVHQEWHVEEPRSSVK